MTNSGTLQGDGADARDMGRKRVMGTGGPVTGGSKGYGLGGSIKEEVIGRDGEIVYGGEEK